MALCLKVSWIDMDERPGCFQSDPKNSLCLLVIGSGTLLKDLIMIEFRAAMKSIASAFIFSTLLASGVVTLAQAQQQNYTVLAPDRSIAVYDTELFNLLLDRNHPRERDWWMAE